MVNLCLSNNSENLLARSVIKSLLGQSRIKPVLFIAGLHVGELSGLKRASGYGKARETLCGALASGCAGLHPSLVSLNTHTHSFKGYLLFDF